MKVAINYVHLKIIFRNTDIKIKLLIYCEIYRFIIFINLTILTNENIKKNMN